MPIEIYNRQRKVVGFDTRALTKRAMMVADAAEIPQHEVCVTLVSDKRIHLLNRDYRSKDRPTDVLSFAQNEGELSELNPTVLGDVLISVETAERQREDRSLFDEVTHLLIHGVLHLLGYDHEVDDEAEVMEAEERRIWAHLRSNET
ncbi:MAG: putative rRNA maturation factor [Myxococcota bacterium]|jgi:probable rRNA maturation factor